MPALVRACSTMDSITAAWASRARPAHQTTDRQRKQLSAFQVKTVLFIPLAGLRTITCAPTSKHALPACHTLKAWEWLTWHDASPLLVNVILRRECFPQDSTITAHDCDSCVVTARLDAHHRERTAHIGQPRGSCMNHHTRRVELRWTHTL